MSKKKQTEFVIQRTEVVRRDPPNPAPSSSAGAPPGSPSPGAPAQGPTAVTRPKVLTTDELKEAFSLFDKDGDGNISAAELETVMKSLGQQPSTEELAAIVEELDEDKNGTIECDEFVKLMMSYQQQKDTHESEMREAFKFFDRKNRGVVSAAEFREVMTQLGDKLTHEEVDDMMREAEVKGDGDITYEQFCKMLYFS